MDYWKASVYELLIDYGYMSLLQMEQTSGMTSHHCYYCSPSIKLCQLPLNVKPGLLTNEKGHKLLETGSHSSYKVGSGSDLFFLQTHKKELRLQGHFPKV